jgi:hypothetical protein
MNRIKEDSHHIKHHINSECPSCRAALDMSIGAGIPGQPAPRPGDLCLCAHCGEPARFGQDMRLEMLGNLEKERLLTEHPELARAGMFIKARLVVEDPEGRRYTDQLDTMLDEVRAWKAKHHDLDLSIQYNYQKEVGVIGTLRDGIKNRFLTVNDHAMTMFQELGWLEDRPTMPTIIMVRCVMDHAFGKEE